AGPGGPGGCSPRMASKSKPKPRAKPSPAKPGRGGRRPGAGRKPEKRYIEAYEVLGPPPEDELDAIRYAYKHLSVAMRQIALDKALTDRERRAELRSTARSMGALLPRARLRQAEIAVRQQHEKLKTDVDPQLEAAPTSTTDGARTRVAPRASVNGEE